MNPQPSNPSGSAAPKTSPPDNRAHDKKVQPKRSSRTGRRRLSGAWGLLFILALLVVGALPPFAALGENPAAEIFKQGTNTSTYGVDPQGDSWASIQRSLQQFEHPDFILRLFLSFTLAVACGWVVAWHPRRSSRLDSLSDLEERKTLILLGMVGAIVAELAGTNATLAFVIFGIGALLRFRTLLDNPKLTGKAITVVVIGLACGMGFWAMAVFVTLFSWVLIFWLDSHIACRIRIRVAEDVDPKLVFGTVQALLVARRCRLQSSALYKGKRQLVFLLHIPAEMDVKQLELDLRGKLPKADDARIDIEVV